MGQKTQLELDFESGLTERYPVLMDAVRYAVHSSGRPLKAIAADLDKSQSEFSRELADDTNPNDPRNFKLRDLSATIDACGDRGKDIIYWLIEKHLEDPQARKQRAQTMLAEMMPKLIKLMEEMESRND